MAAINEHTRKMITTAIKKTSDEYREGWDRIFGKKKPAREQHECPNHDADGVCWLCEDIGVRSIAP